MYTIEDEKLELVVSLYNEKIDPSMTSDTIKFEICSDWNEGDDHQEWINQASPKEIVSWLQSFLE